MDKFFVKVIKNDGNLLKYSYNITLNIINGDIMTVSKNDSTLTNDTKIALLEQSIGHINETLLRIEKRFDSIDKKFDLVDKKFDLVDKKFDSLEAKMDVKVTLLENKMDKGFSEFRREINDTRLLSWSQFRWLLGTMVICILIPIAKGFLS